MTEMQVMQLIGAIVVLLVQAVGVTAYFNRVMREERAAWAAAVEALHGRINNIRKEFVTDAAYQRDLAEMKQLQRETLQAIARVGDQVTTKIGRLEQVNAVQEFRLNALDDKANGRNITRSSQPVT